MTIDPVGPAYMAAHKVKIGKKTVRFTDKSGRTSIRFERGVTHGNPDFTITVEESVPVVQKCNLGHSHETGKQERMWGNIQLSWSDAEKLMDWFEGGNWREVRGL